MPPRPTTGARDDKLTRLRVFARSFVIDPNGCWTWQKATTQGYASFYSKTLGASVRGHRYAYELIFGLMPTNLVPDHLCRNRACVNPKHLEVVTSATNILRGIGPTAQNAVKEFCVNGHELTPENVRPDYRGGRMCRPCDNAMGRIYRHERMQAKLAAIERGEVEVVVVARNKRTGTEYVYAKRDVNGWRAKTILGASPFPVNGDDLELLPAHPDSERTSGEPKDGHV